MKKWILSICILMSVLLLGSCKTPAKEAKQDCLVSWSQLEKTGELDLEYTTMFSVSYYEGGYKEIIIGEEHYIVVPEGKEIPKDTDSAAILQQPFDQIYLAATAAMDMIVKMKCLDKVTMSSIEASDWCVPEAIAAMEDGKLTYAGKYSTPDFEMLLANNCDLAIESTMIYHSPEVKEQLENVGIPVLVDYSSHEKDPLGRLEWIKLYGALFDCEEEASDYFDEQVKVITNIGIPEGEKKSVVFFYFASDGSVAIRKPDDYVTKMIEMAGGTYPFGEELSEENALSTTKIQMEAFYEYAKSADILIYNSTIHGQLVNVDELLQEQELLKDFKAVKNNEVYCTSRDMYQQSTGVADMILDFNKVISNSQVEDKELTYLYRLK